MSGDGAAGLKKQIRRGTHRFRHSFHLGGLAVAPEQQGRGVGTRLMRDLLGELRAEGVVRVELGVSADHPRGIAFYEKLSF
ncbi:MAG: GNAT family N-acetyltransferase [Verrucomicrobiales bacterium]|jgi:ribosomal protein S18 acetylase RimI-like enzyme|nr:GNAT family N-acetyltransferase [Verrucomicrobiales bacterium]